MKKYFFAGIGGSGMSPLAQILRQGGCWVGGSDRNMDRGAGLEFFARLKKLGILLFPQDGTGITAELDALVISSAIEDDNIEMQKARSLGIAVLHRTELLAEIFNTAYGIGIGGTSGKTTVTGMVAAILEQARKDPTVINGGICKQYETDSLIGNAKRGTSEIVLIETDESDGSIKRFFPKIGVLTNISRDHKELEELQKLFQTFADNSSQCFILNGDCPVSQTITAKNRVTYGLQDNNSLRAKGLELGRLAITFNVRDTCFYLNVPGKHNVYNALAAIAVGLALAIPLVTIKEGLAAFRGIRRRLEVIGEKNGITLVDDFAHNPAKIISSIAALKRMGKRLVLIFQPHGYGPTKFLLPELALAFARNLDREDLLFLLDIYDAGGTADRSVSSADLAKAVSGPKIFYIPKREQVIAQVTKLARSGDVVCVMGARDDTLGIFVRQILSAMS